MTRCLSPPANWASRTSCEPFSHQPPLLAACKCSTHLPVMDDRSTTATHGRVGVPSSDLRKVFGNRTSLPSLDQLGQAATLHHPPALAVGASVRACMNPFCRSMRTCWLISCPARILYGEES